MDRLEAMHHFVRVCELGSFAAAATHAGVTRSVVTRQIASLEAHLGVKLLTRSTRRIALTSAGTAFLDKSRAIIDLVDAAETEATQEQRTPRGRIRVSIPLSFGLRRLAPLFVEFSRQHPEIELDMDFSDRRVNLIEEAIDLSIRITGHLEPGDIARRIGTCRLLAVAAPAYLASRGQPRHPRDLVEHACLGYTAGISERTWPFMIGGSLSNVPIRSRIRANNGDVLAYAATMGLGITVQPDFIVQEALDAGLLETVLQGFPAPELGIYALLPSARYLPHRVRTLVDFLAGQLRATGSANSPVMAGESPPSASRRSRVR